MEMVKLHYKIIKDLLLVVYKKLGSKYIKDNELKTIVNEFDIIKVLYYNKLIYDLGYFC